MLRLLFAFILWGFLLASGGALALGLYAIALLPELPTIEEIRRPPLNIPLRLYSNDGSLIAEYGNERRIPVSLDNTPPFLIDAILVTEDENFYHHRGVDFIGIARAVLSNFRSKSRGQGGSTITMQVARNFFLTPEKTYIRKLKEILLAFNMERALTKDEILELYLNKIFLGNRAYGFAAASKIYYGNELEDLSLPEVAMLAGLPKAPSRDNPISNAKRAVERRSYVLKRLRETDKIDDFAYQAARAAPITAGRGNKIYSNAAPYAVEAVRQTMLAHFGEAVYERGLEITLTINVNHQEHADRALRKGLFDYDRRHGFRGALDNINLSDHDAASIHQILLSFPNSHELLPAVVTEVKKFEFNATTQEQENISVAWNNIKWAKPYQTPDKVGGSPADAFDVVRPGDIIYVAKVSSGWRLAQMPEVDGALISIETDSGAIRAMSGGFDYYLSEFNRATQAKRQPGSNIKPFIYSAALENGFTASSLVSAAPVVIDDNLEGVWRPQNYSKKFFGPTRLRKALSRSLNLVSVRLVRALGIDTTREHLEKFGFGAEQVPNNLSIALGSINASPIQMVAAFAVFANKGERVRPYLIERIIDGDGNEVMLSREECELCKPQTNQPDADKQIISQQLAFVMRDMLQQVIRSGTGRRALSLQRDDLGGKTGTTNDFRDAWFSGFSSDIATTVFVGFDEPAYLGGRESGATAALPIWVEYMGNILPNYPQKLEFAPRNIVTRFVDINSGALTTSDDPNGYKEYYIAGTEPTASADADNLGAEIESSNDSLF